MVFHKAQRKTTQFQIKIEDTIIEQVSDFNFFGLTINQHLNWNGHADKISNKISRNIWILNKLKHTLPLNTKVLIYNSLILSHINYDLLAWGYSCARITKLQKRLSESLALVSTMHTQNQFLKRYDYLK